MNSKEEAVKSGPKCYRNYMTLAVRLYLEKKYSQAIHFFGEALELSPGNKHCLVARSKCYLKEGRPDKALTDTELALQSDKAFPDAVLQKAESYFQQSNFEAALVHFHRGSQFQVKQEMFIKGVYKCEEAILNAVRWLDKVKKKIGEETTDEERSDTKKTEDKNMTSVFVFENDSTLPSENKMWILLAELYEDKTFLQKVLRKIDCRREHGWLSKLVVINQIVYFNNQSKFLLAKMPVIERLKQGARSKLTDDLQEINRIYKAKKFRECIDKCVNILNTYSTKELESKQRHLAEVYSMIGACYLEKKMMEEARIIYVNLLAIGDMLDDSEITLNAVSGIVVTYSDDKEYKMFVDAGEVDNVGISELQEMWFNYRLGLSYLGVNNTTAKKYMKMCIDCAETGMNRHYLTHSLVLLACAHVRTKNFKEALKSIQTCYDYIKEQSKDSIVAVENVLNLLVNQVREDEAAHEENIRDAQVIKEKGEDPKVIKEQKTPVVIKGKKREPPVLTEGEPSVITEGGPSVTSRGGLSDITDDLSFITDADPSLITEDPSLIPVNKGARSVKTERDPSVITGEPSVITDGGEGSFITEGEPSVITEGERSVIADSQGDPLVIADSQGDPLVIADSQGDPLVIADDEEKEPVVAKEEGDVPTEEQL